MGISTEQRVYRNLTPSQLYEHALRRREGVVTAGGPFAAVTSPHTGRSPNDKFLVQEPESSSQIWWGKVNQPLAPEKFEQLKADVEQHLASQELFVRDVYAGADLNYRLPIRFVTPNAWHALFVYNMFLRPSDEALSMHCSANVSTQGDCSLFFGLSGTGKTTLSADPERRLIGDDEHGWSDAGI